MDDVARMRRFNRTVTHSIGALESHFLGRPRSLGASRVLFEVGEAGREIRDLRERLGLDSGYASRLVAGLEAEGLVRSTASKDDARVRLLRLTRAGRKELAVLNRSSDERAASILRALTEPERTALVEAMATVERTLLASSVRMNVVAPMDPAAAACLSRYYRELASRFEGGFDAARTLPVDPAELTPPQGYLVLAALHGRPVACGALKLHGDAGEIKRMWVAPDARGLGLGRRLLARLEALARDHGVRTLRLETNRALTEAQALYRASGYREVAPFNAEPYAHHWFAKRL